MLDNKYDWTISLGQAYFNQPGDVMDAIQRLRTKALQEGNLVSTPQQGVIVTNGLIQIVPAAPQVIYVPQYDPLIVYTDPAPAYGFITFGVGFSIGAWLNRDCDWRHQTIFYHGWRGEGWASRARKYISPQLGTYSNSRNMAININRNVLQHDTARYREDLHSNVEQRRENRAPASVSTRHETLPQHSTPQPVKVVTPTAVLPSNTDLYRGRIPQDSQPAANTGYGGYGNSADAKTYRERGQISRGRMQQINRQQPSPSSITRPANISRPTPTGGNHPSPARPAVQNSGKRQLNQ